MPGVTAELCSGSRREGSERWQELVERNKSVIQLGLTDSLCCRIGHLGSKSLSTISSRYHSCPHPSSPCLTSSGSNHYPPWRRSSSISSLALDSALFRTNSSPGRLPRRLPEIARLHTRWIYPFAPARATTSSSPCSSSAGGLIIRDWPPSLRAHLRIRLSPHQTQGRLHSLCLRRKVVRRGPQVEVSGHKEDHAGEDEKLGEAGDAHLARAGARAEGWREEGWSHGRDSAYRERGRALAKIDLEIGVVASWNGMGLAAQPRDLCVLVRTAGVRCNEVGIPPASPRHWQKGGDEETKGRRDTEQGKEATARRQQATEQHTITANPHRRQKFKPRLGPLLTFTTDGRGQA